MYTFCNTTTIVYNSLIARLSPAGSGGKRSSVMCGRYYLDDDPAMPWKKEKMDAYADKFQIEIKTSGEFYPTDIAPVIAPSGISRAPLVFPMRWGFMHPYRERVIVSNTRIETAGVKEFFRDTADSRRCLVPISGYYEWKKLPENKVERYAFHTDGLIYLAALYTRRPEHPVPCFSVLTMDAVPAIKSIHARMPVLLTAEQQSDWLDAKLPIREAPDWCTVKDALTAEKCDFI